MNKLEITKKLSIQKKFLCHFEKVKSILLIVLLKGDLVRQVNQGNFLSHLLFHLLFVQNLNLQ
jgi:hypothetical protein